MGVKHINFHVSEEEHQKMLEEKGDRTWREVVLESLGLEDEV